MRQTAAMARWLPPRPGRRRPADGHREGATMNDTPGWASPGSAPVRRAGPRHVRTPSPRPADRDPAHEPSSPPPPKWSKEQPPPASGPPPRPAPASTSAHAARPDRPVTGPAGRPDPPARLGRRSAPDGRLGRLAPRPAAKPGVIPLRPLGVGEILDGAVSTMRAHWRTVLGISLTVAVAHPDRRHPASSGFWSWTPPEHRRPEATRAPALSEPWTAPWRRLLAIGVVLADHPARHARRHRAAHHGRSAAPCWAAR